MVRAPLQIWIPLAADEWGRRETGWIIQFVRAWNDPKVIFRVAIGKRKCASSTVSPGRKILPRVVFDKHREIAVINRVIAFVHENHGHGWHWPDDVRNPFVGGGCGGICAQDERSDIAVPCVRASVHLSAHGERAGWRELEEFATAFGFDVVLIRADVDSQRGVVFPEEASLDDGDIGGPGYIVRQLAAGAINPRVF